MSWQKEYRHSGVREPRTFVSPLKIGLYVYRPKRPQDRSDTGDEQSNARTLSFLGSPRRRIDKFSNINLCKLDGQQNDNKAKCIQENRVGRKVSKKCA